MAKQLLIYGKVETVSAKKHSDLSVKAGEDYEFARGINSVPIMAAEFPNVSLDCAIVFAGTEELVMPVMLMGFREGENLYLDKTGSWMASYVPAFFRRYPFVFSSTDDGEPFTLCIDEYFPGWNTKGRGERLFNAEGEQTQYTKNVLEFLKEYQVSYQRTEAFSKRLQEMDLLEPMTAQFTTGDGFTGNLTGFKTVNRDKIKSLNGEQLAKLAATDELELIYIHIHSLMNFTGMMKKLESTNRVESEEIPAKVKPVKAREVATKPKTISKKSKTKATKTSTTKTANKKTSAKKK